MVGLPGFIILKLIKSPGFELARQLLNGKRGMQQYTT
jgi:hypothetical protein